MWIQVRPPGLSRIAAPAESANLYRSVAPLRVHVPSNVSAPGVACSGSVLLAGGVCVVRRDLAGDPLERVSVLELVDVDERSALGRVAHHLRDGLRGPDVREDGVQRR